MAAQRVGMSEAEVEQKLREFREEQLKHTFVDAMEDYGFKKLLSDEETVLRVINLLIKPEHKFMRVESMNVEQQPDSYFGKKMIYDVHCRNEFGELYIIEMQQRDEGNFIDRSITYVMNSLVHQLTPNNNYIIKGVYGLFFTKFKIDGCDGLVTRVELRESNHNSVFWNKLKLTYVDLSAFTKNQDECSDDENILLYNIKNMYMMQTLYNPENDPLYVKMEDRMKCRTPDELDAIILRQMNDYVVRKVEEQDRAKNRAEALAEGRAEGMAEGRAVGRAEGRAEGMAEGRIVDAKAFLLNGVSIDVIAATLHLTDEEIKAVVS